MKFPIYWKRVQNEKGTLSARGWSDLSSDDAMQNARKRLDRIQTALRSDTLDQLRNDYQYVSDHLICEFVVDRILDNQGVEVGIVSRNAYGSLILNTSRLMMIDIDLPQESVRGWFQRVFGRSKSDRQEEKLQQLREWQKLHPEFTFRVYRTAGGLRLLASNRVIDQIDQNLFMIMEDLNADPLYLKLCRQQKCFRARLMPKPWRIGMSRPPKTFPFENIQAEKEFDAWFGRYLEGAKQYKVCRYLTTLGSAPIHPAIVQLIDLHDQFCCREEELTLA